MTLQQKRELRKNPYQKIDSKRDLKLANSKLRKQLCRYEDNIDYRLLLFRKRLEENLENPRVLQEDTISFYLVAHKTLEATSFVNVFLTKPSCLEFISTNNSEYSGDLGMLELKVDAAKNKEVHYLLNFLLSFGVSVMPDMEKQIEIEEKLAELSLENHQLRNQIELKEQIIIDLENPIEDLSKSPPEDQLELKKGVKKSQKKKKEQKD